MIQIKATGKYTSDTITEISPRKKDKLSISKYVLFALNGIYDSYHDGVITKNNWMEDVTISSNSATSSKSGVSASDCILVNSSGTRYKGTITGTTISCTCADGGYKAFYNLLTPESISCFKTLVALRSFELIENKTSLSKVGCLSWL